jgi:molybdopterin adenylyltransferase
MIGFVEAAVITVSDRVWGGDREDESGPAVAVALERAGFRVIATRVVPDERDGIERALRELHGSARLVVTTGGTGLGARDVTPEATTAVVDRVVPGLAEAMRAAGRAGTPTADLSRGVVGVLGTTLVVNVPGNPNGAVESLEAVLPAVPHALAELAGGGVHDDAHARGAP